MKTEFETPPEIIEKWRKLGFYEDMLPLLPMIPAIQVAWAEGFMQAGERRVLLQLFEETENGKEEIKRTLLGWLDERPTDEFFAETTEILSEWLAKMSSWQAAVLRDFLHASCVRVANASAVIGLKTGNQTISREERRQLELIGNQLGFTLA